MRFEEKERLWNAVNRYAEACGGDTGSETVSGARMDAVVAVDDAVDTIIMDRAERAVERAMKGPRRIEIPEKHIMKLARLGDAVMAAGAGEKTKAKLKLWREVQKAVPQVDVSECQYQLTFRGHRAFLVRLEESS